MPIKNPKKNNAYVVIGSFGTVHGVKGWIKINSYTDPAENIKKYKHWYVKIKDQWELLPIEDLKTQHKTLLLKLTDCGTPEDARFYTNKLIGIKREELPDLESNEFYWHDLIGLEVKNLKGELLGTVIEILSTGANDVFVVKRDDGKRYLIPYTADAVQSIDIDNQFIMVDWE